MRRLVALLLTGLLFPVGGAFAQQPAAAKAPLNPADEAAQRLRLASTSEDYPVTPGDQYRLTYRQGDSLASLDLAVENDYRLGLGLFGRLDTRGLTYLQLKDAVDRLILTGYPRSMPNLSLVSLGVFRVFVRGEIPQASYVAAWGLSRLGDVLDGVDAPLASRRNVQLISRDGSSRIFDLDKAIRQGLLDENPPVKPGDQIVLVRSERRVQLAGEVRRQGTYELLPNEQLGDLLNGYGGGMTGAADGSRIRIDYVSGGKSATRRVSIQSDSAAATVLNDGDVVMVPPGDSRLPIVSFEGAVKTPTAQKATPGSPAASESSAEPASDYGRLLYSYRDGETLSDALVAVKDSFTPLADLASGSVVREGELTPLDINLQDLLGSPDSGHDLILKPNDRIIVPQSRFVVYVSGAVEKPGVYPYTPNRDSAYYLTLAGGTRQQDPRSVQVTDRSGVGRPPEAAILSEDRIYVVEELISVQGAVFSPGTFPFHVDQQPAFYIGLAGGNDPERNTNCSFSLFDEQGKAKKNTDPLTPGDRIYLPTNNGMYNLVKYAPLIATVVSTVLTALLIYAQVTATK